MAQLTEKRLYAVLPQLFTGNGTNYGQINVANSALFTVKQKVQVEATGLPNLILEVKRIPNINTILVGPIQGNIDSRTDVSAYTVSLGANIAAVEQPRPIIPQEIIPRAVYQDEPVVAIRTTLVDNEGDNYSTGNPLPVAFDGTVSIGTVEVTGPSGNFLNPNPDGSINVIVESGSGGTVVFNTFNSITSVASGVTTLLLSYTVPAATTANMFRIEYGGDNIAQYDVKVNTVLIARRRTYFGADIASTFEFAANGANGYALNAGDNVSVYVTHSRPYLGDFEARLQVTIPS